MNNRTRIGLLLAWIVALIVIVCLLVGYSSVVGTRLYEDAKRSFAEVYEQVDNNFVSFMHDTWKNLTDWGPYIHDLDDEDAVAYMNNRKSVWGFSRFFFIDQSSDAISLSGEVQHIDLGDDESVLLERRIPIMTESGLDSAVPETIFASPITEGSFMGHDYEAIAITYTNEALASTIKTDAFKGESMGFVVYPDGTIAFSTQEGGNVFSNYITYLSAGSNLSDEQLGQLKGAWEAGESGVEIFELNKIEYYMCYQPLGYEDYVLLGVVPSSAVSGEIRRVQEMTVDVLVKVFAILAVMLVVQFLVYIRQRSRKSRAEIEYRDVLFRLLAENLDDVFIVADADDMKVSYVSPNAERLLGLPAEKIGNDIRSMLEGIADENPVASRGMLDSIATGERLEVSQEWINQHDGSRRWFRDAIYRMDIQGSQKYIFIMSDRTADRKMSQSLEEALEAAKNANLAKSQFLSNMSHDIRTPMNSIMGFTNLLEMHASEPDRVEEYVTKISASSRHLLNLINDVLDMSKIESGKTDLNVEEFEFAELLDEVCAIMAPQAQAKGQAFEMRVEGEPAKYLMGDKLRINQILINLLSNAVKYTQSGGTIEFQVQELPSDNPHFERIRFIVRDDGMGMSEDYLKVIFEPFTREINSVTNSIQGTGLGMAITKNLVDLMGGIIEVESKLGEGSTFAIDLKFATVDAGDHVEDEMPSKEEASPDALKGLSILAAEDNEMSAELLMEYLDMEGATVRRVSNGQEAVDAFEGSKPGEYDLILMDVQMPVMGGYDATRAIRSSSHPDAEAIPIFAMTANVFAEDVRDALEAGMDAHIAKPIDINVLKQTVEQKLGRRDDGQQEPAKDDGNESAQG